jgi:hypothetical protein
LYDLNWFAQYYQRFREVCNSNHPISLVFSEIFDLPHFLKCVNESSLVVSGSANGGLLVGVAGLGGLGAGRDSACRSGLAKL